MDYCIACRRHLNGAFTCPGCGRAARDEASPAAAENAGGGPVPGPGYRPRQGRDHVFERPPADLAGDGSEAPGSSGFGDSGAFGRTFGRTSGPRDTGDGRDFDAHRAFRRDQPGGADLDFGGGGSRGEYGEYGEGSGRGERGAYPAGLGGGVPRPRQSSEYASYGPPAADFPGRAGYSAHADRSASPDRLGSRRSSGEAEDDESEDLGLSLELGRGGAAESAESGPRSRRGHRRRPKRSRRAVVGAVIGVVLLTVAVVELGDVITPEDRSEQALPPTETTGPGPVTGTERPEPEESETASPEETEPIAGTPEPEPAQPTGQQPPPEPDPGSAPPTTAEPTAPTATASATGSTEPRPTETATAEPSPTPTGTGPTESEEPEEPDEGEEEEEEEEEEDGGNDPGCHWWWPFC